MRKTFLVLALAASGLAAPAFAANSVGVGYSQASVDDFTVDAITARAGWNGGGVFGLEGEASLGINSDVVGTGPTRSEAELDYQVALYATATVPMGERFEVIGRVGYGFAKSTVSVGALAPASYDDSGVALGAALQWNMNDMNALRLDYTSAAGSPGLARDTPTAWTVSFVRRF